MAIENISVLDSSGIVRLVQSDIVGADGSGNSEYAQVVKTGYRADGDLSLMDEKPATAARQDTGNADLAAILSKLSSDPATQTTLVAVLAKLTSDPATQTTLAAVLAKLSSDPATQTTLAAIKSDVDKLPGQGQAAASASMPVVLPAAQVSTLTPPAAITGFALETGGNLATLAGVVSSSKAAVKSADGDLVTVGAKADPPATTATTDPWTVVSLLKCWRRSACPKRSWRSTFALSAMGRQL